MKVKTKPFEYYGFNEKSGQYFWWASWYAKLLGYKSLITLMPAIIKSEEVCVDLGLRLKDNFIHDESVYGNDIKLSKFACFLIALQADQRKPMVKKGKLFFLNQMEELNYLFKEQDFLDRILNRKELKRLHNSLMKMARKSSVRDFSYFMNEGYIGLYNRPLSDLKEFRNLKASDDLYDNISNMEMTANLFRLTMTVERLKLINSKESSRTAKEFWKIGQDVRSMIKENTGQYPENLPKKENLKLLQKRLQKAQYQLNHEVKQLSQMTTR